MPNRLVFATLFQAVLAWSSRLPNTASFDEFVVAFGRSYTPGSAQYAFRKGLFDHHASQVRLQNNKMGALWRAGHNEFSDWTDVELQSLRGLRVVRRAKIRSHRAAGFLAKQVDLKQVDLPATADWSHLGSLQRAPNQGSCGSCWAFASSKMLDSRYEILTNETTVLSPQQLVDCVANPQECGGSGGCSGATVELAMDYVQEHGLANLQSVADYPYEARDGQCPRDLVSLYDATMRQIQNHPPAELLSYQTLPSNQAEPLMEALLDGPVAVAAAASLWNFYATGIFDECTLVSDWEVDHAVLAIGFGEEGEKKFWRILNSWGQHWGENGQIRLLRESGGPGKEACGTDYHPEFGVSCKPYPDSVETCGMCGVLYDSVAAKLGFRTMEDDVI